jgi:ABC-2 type transport system ATP-binding protein
MRPGMLPVALCLRNVSVRYGRRVAVCGLSLDVRRGEVVGLLGPNGSGKSSTLLAAAGVIDPAAGTVSIDGITRKQDTAGFAAQVGLVPQDPALYDELSAIDNLAFFGKLYGLRDFTLDARIGRALIRARLSDRGRCKVGTFSGGMKQRLSIACALLHDPAVLLLDEPTAALDPASRDQLFADLHALRDEGHAILLSTHHLDEAEHGCDRVVVLKDGVAEASGPPREVFRSPAGAVLYGHLRQPLPKFVEKQLAERLGPGVSFEITGRRLRLAAATEAELGQALAAVLAEGATLTTFRTPPAAPRTREAA